MKCKNCDSNRILSVSAKVGDQLNLDYFDNTYEGEVPNNIGIGNFDYIKFRYCLDCGIIQDDFPKYDSELVIDLI